MDLDSHNRAETWHLPGAVWALPGAVLNLPGVNARVAKRRWQMNTNRRTSTPGEVWEVFQSFYIYRIE